MDGQIERTLAIVELLADYPDGVGLSVVSEQLDIPKSAAHRILARLVAREFVHQDGFTQFYRLSVRFAAIGFRYLAGSGLNEICQPELEALAAKTGEFVRLAVVSGDRLTFIAEAQGARRGLRYEGEYGRRDVRLHATATGKAWLATLPRDEAVRLVLEQGFVPKGELGPRAVRTVPALITELARTRRQGYAAAFEEGDPGVAAVAAAIPGIGPHEPAVGTIAVIGPTVRLPRKRMLELAPSLIAAAGRLSSLWPMRRKLDRTAVNEPPRGSDE